MSSAESSPSPEPFVLVTVLLDGAARPAAVTRSHGNALERAINATASQAVAGLDLVEMPIQPAVFDALRKALSLDAETVGLYDLFPIAPQVDETVRKVAGQFLAAEAIWTLEEQGQLGGVPINITLELPGGWNKDPRKVHERLVQAGALELSPSAVATFNSVKSAWDASTENA